MMRPRPARWFEALVARDDTTLLLSALAATGAVELEARSGATLPETYAAARPGLARYAEFRSRYGAYWPSSGLVPSTVPEPPAATLDRGLAVLAAWGEEAEPHIRELQALEARRAELVRWQALVAPLAKLDVDVAALAAAGPIARAALLEIPEGAALRTDGTLLMALGDEAPGFALAVGSTAGLESITREALALKGRVHPVPTWLTNTQGTNEIYIARNLDEVARAEGEAREALERAAQHHGLRAVLADLGRLEWVLGHVRALESGERFAWVTGWTSDASGAAIAAAVERSGARALVHCPTAPPTLHAPLLFSNPRWARPFELFPRALGMPGGAEADPTVILAITVPLLFGYMFGDVGQGLVIAVAGWLLRKRLPVGRLLAAGGASAVVFGFLFGSTFSTHGVPHPLWVDPLAHPIEVLVVPIAAGAILLTLGLALHALGTWWRGERALCLGEDLGLIACYAGIALSIFDSRGVPVVAAGVAMVVAGRIAHEGRAGAAGPALGELLEHLFQLSVNTLSFARVGAFALAHAGLSSAVIALSGEAGPAGALVFILGNAFVIALEALLVSIQATRLVLFEFFNRFLTGTGRAFRPLAAPPFLQESP